MKFFKGKDWIAGLIRKSKPDLTKIQLNDLSERLNIKRLVGSAITLSRQYRMSVLKAVGTVGVFAAISIGGHQFVKENLVEVYHVFVGNEMMGTVSDPQVVEQYVLSKYKKLQQENPDIHMMMNSDEITYKTERALKKQAADEYVLGRIDGMLTPKAIGVELIVDGKMIGFVKDKETANQILEEIKKRYVPKKKESGRVSILSASKPSELEPGKSELVSESFIQKVELKTKEIRPEDLIDPKELIQKLQTGDVQPTKYKVEPGDCVSCIAKKFDVSKQLIYENNPWIVDDKIKVGQEIDLTVLQPTLSVKTVEKIMENQEVQHDIIYEKDGNLRKGVTKTIKPGKNGLKKATFLVTKVNGMPMDEELIEEELIEEPVAEIARKGTKVIIGEGTGRFIWPVSGAKLTSSYGMRWGRMHKGIDMSGNRNILAADNGEVIFAGNKNDGYGNMIIIDHKNGYRTVYAHLSKFYTIGGKIVEKGEKIGYMGDTGDSTGVHLHFEVQRWGNAENPMKFLSR